jgi:hypothetical protein
MLIICAARDDERCKQQDARRARILTVIALHSPLFKRAAALLDNVNRVRTHANAVAVDATNGQPRGMFTWFELRMPLARALSAGKILVHCCPHISAVS